MSEHLPPPDAARFPELEEDPRWVREVPPRTAVARIFRASGLHSGEWHAFRTFGPLDGRFDPHPEPVGEHTDASVLYGVLESSETLGREAGGGGADGSFAAALLEVFQSTRMIRTGVGAPTLAVFETRRPLRLLDLSDSDWITVAGGNAAISSGGRAAARAWARAIAQRYPSLDGVVSASSLVPTARVVALWKPAENALPQHPSALIRLDRPEMAGVIDRIADRYGYAVL
ncbi:hypothetical protein [Leucobacter ruminantium]|uniref:RES domain-containing protein n=1 Tax=Leucobacter ruminantium TaxID=1289170 RepID=A0A939RTR7_9MICO|nr:hypothetical protein [Leucobacter ruminantium]MBO1804740.1 hypothetical protein [Leucobacter ruminantium]